MGSNGHVDVRGPISATVPSVMWRIRTATPLPLFRRACFALPRPAGQGPVLGTPQDCHHPGYPPLRRPAPRCRDGEQVGAERDGGRQRHLHRRPAPARPRRRGHRQGSPATEAGTLWRGGVRRVAPGALRRPRRGREDRRDPRLPRTRLRDHRPTRGGAGLGRGPPPSRGRPRSAGQRPLRGALRGDGQDRRRDGPVLEGLQVDIDEIEVQVFEGDPNASKRIYTRQPRGDRVPTGRRAAGEPVRLVARTAEGAGRRVRSRVAAAPCGMSPTTRHGSWNARGASESCWSTFSP